MDEILFDEPAPGVRRITLNRPDKLNSFTYAMYAALITELESLRLRTDVRVVILTGAGRGFCSGHDISGGGGEATFVPEGTGTMQRKTLVNAEISRIPALMRALPQPVICAVNGVTAGIGYAVMLASDMAIAARTARFVNAIHNAATGTELGMSWMLPRMIGTQRAAEILFTARPVLSDEAERIGLVLRTVEDEALMAEVLALADNIIVNVPLGIALTKRSLWMNQGVGSIEAAIEIETRACIIAQATQDAVEKRSAFIERRPPSFSGC